MAQVSIERQPVPDTLAPATIAKIKRTALLQKTAAAARAAQRTLKLAAAPFGAQFLHPGGYAGAPELSLLSARLRAGRAAWPVQDEARSSLLTGSYVDPKVYPGGWAFRTDTPATGYGGPMPMAKFEADYGGVTNTADCPANYPAGAPRGVCGHVALVEIDGMMAYKSAMAFYATGDARYAQQAAAAIRAWSTTNRVFGLNYRNGPLEAAWACGAMARAAELLRSSRASGFGQAQVNEYVSWVRKLLMPNMDHYINTVSRIAIENGRKNVYGNWHASIADCQVAVGILAEDRGWYNKGVALYKTTLGEYFKWGRGAWAAGRIIGESTETLRDIYHFEFGLGSLVQVAETAWAQNEDLYSASGYALAAAMELHARIINAGLDKDESGLPPGFKFYSSSMPKPPPGCSWRWDIETQLWASFNSSGAKCSDLADGVKYVVGVTLLPTGWEIGYNHFVGRLGMRLPETARLLTRGWPDTFTFHWGLGTLSHADSASVLWRPGVRVTALCRASQRRLSG